MQSNVFRDEHLSKNPGRARPRPGKGLLSLSLAVA